jgi:hypothetical protein
MMVMTMTNEVVEIVPLSVYLSVHRTEALHRTSKASFPLPQAKQRGMRILVFLVHVADLG